MCEAVMDAVERRADGRRVESVRLRVGTLHRIVPSAMEQAFSLVSAGTIADGASVELVDIPAGVTCGTCGAETETAEPLATCPACGAADVELRGGDDLTLESLRLTATASDENPEPRPRG